jgi:hypothetical protein
MEIYSTKRMTIELRDDEIETMAEILKLAHDRLRNSPTIQMHGSPLVRQAGLVGPALGRVKMTLEKAGDALGVDLPYDALPDGKPENCALIVASAAPPNNKMNEKEGKHIRESASRLLSALLGLLDVVDAPPEANCSCNIAPPCSDCVEHSALREALADARIAVGLAEGGGE